MTEAVRDTARNQSLGGLTLQGDTNRHKLPDDSSCSRSRHHLFSLQWTHCARLEGSMKLRCRLWLSIFIVLYGRASTAQTGRTHVTVIGIKAFTADNDLRRPWLKYADQDAELFADYVKSRPASDVVAAILTDRPSGLSATSTNIRTTLERMLIPGDRRTGRRLHLYLRTRSCDVRILRGVLLDAIDTQSEKGSGSAVLISDLRRIISQSRARHIFIFADASP